MKRNVFLFNVGGLYFLVVADDILDMCQNDERPVYLMMINLKQDSS